jgi:hypothetical protein
LLAFTNFTFDHVAHILSAAEAVAGNAFCPLGDGGGIRLSDRALLGGIY